MILLIKKCSFFQVVLELPHHLRHPEECCFHGNNSSNNSSSSKLQWLPFHLRHLATYHRGNNKPLLRQYSHQWEDPHHPLLDTKASTQLPRLLHPQEEWA